MKVNVLHRGEGIAGVESFDLQKQLSSDGEIAGPQIAAGFIGYKCVRKAREFALCTYPALKDSDFRVPHCRFLVRANQVFTWDTVVVEKDDQVSRRMGSSAISVGSRALVRSLDDGNDSEFLIQDFASLRGVSVIADYDGTFRMRTDVRDEPAQTSLEQLVPVPRGNDNCNTGQIHETGPIQGRSEESLVTTRQDEIASKAGCIPVGNAANLDFGGSMCWFG